MEPNVNLPKRMTSSLVWGGKSGCGPRGHPEEVSLSGDAERPLRLGDVVHSEGELDLALASAHHQEALDIDTVTRQLTCRPGQRARPVLDVRGDGLASVNL
jgi:hypothetical protein